MEHESKNPEELCREVGYEIPVAKKEFHWFVFKGGSRGSLDGGWYSDPMRNPQAEDGEKFWWNYFTYVRHN